ncbi:hypothetical protein PoB_006974400 [Plakobranchus ocellatus]|uniref:Uncharacterized protein n=1 Tax=Plakobranchus ocellatus TaxID=259542 RepID=A0AAV4DGG8_9GAST|nr:hypothetical protein PoB_006974400 [Plakobranchus ocellatus]
MDGGKKIHQEAETEKQDKEKERQHQTEQKKMEQEILQSHQELAEKETELELKRIRKDVNVTSTPIQQESDNAVCRNSTQYPKGCSCRWRGRDGKRCRTYRKEGQTGATRGAPVAKIQGCRHLMIRATRSIAVSYTTRVKLA